MRSRRRAPLWVALAVLVLGIRGVSSRPSPAEPYPGSMMLGRNGSPLVDMTAEEVAALPVSVLVHLTKKVWHSLTPAQVSRLPPATLHLIPVQAVTLDTLTSYSPKTFQHSPRPTEEMIANQPSIEDQQRILSSLNSDASISPEALLQEGAGRARYMHAGPARGYWSDWTNWYCDKYYWWQWCGEVAFVRTKALAESIKKMSAKVKKAATQLESLDAQVDGFRLNESLRLIDPTGEHDGLTPRAAALYKAVQVEQPAVESAFKEKYPELHELEDAIKVQVDASKDMMGEQFTKSSEEASGNIERLAKHLLEQTEETDKNLQKTVGKLSKAAMRVLRKVARGSSRSLRRVQKDNDRVASRSGRLIDDAANIIAKVNRMMASAGPREKHLLMAMVGKLRERLVQEQARQQRRIRPYERKEDRALAREREKIGGEMKRDMRALDEAAGDFAERVRRRLSKIGTEKAVIERTGRRDLARENRRLGDRLRSDAAIAESASRRAVNAGEMIERQLAADEKGMKERKHLVEAELQQAESRIKTTDNLVEGRLVSSTDRVEKELLGESDLINTDLREEVGEEKRRASRRDMYFNSRIGDLANQAAMERGEEAREVAGAEQGLAAEEGRLDRDIASAGQKQESRVRGFHDHSKGEVDHEARAIEDEGEDEASRLARVMDSLTATEHALMSSMGEDMKGMTDSGREEFMRLRESVSNAYADSEDGMSGFGGVLRTIGGGLQSSIDGQRAVREGLQGTIGNLDREEDKGNAAIQSLGSESSIDLKHQSAEFKKKGVDAVRSVDELLASSIDGTKLVMKDRQRDRMADLRGMLGDLSDTEGGISAINDETHGVLSKVRGEMGEYKQGLIAESNNLDTFLANSEGHEDQTALEATHGFEREQLASIARARQLLVKEMRQAEQGTSEKDVQRAKELKARVVEIDSMLTAGDRRGVKNRAALAGVDHIGNVLRDRASSIHELGLQGMQDGKDEDEAVHNMRRDLMQQLAHYSIEIKNTRGSLDRGVQALDSGLREKTADMRNILKIGKEGLSRVIGVFATILLSAANAELRDILSSNMSQEEKIRAVLKLFEDAQGRFGHEFAATEEERHTAATNLAYSLDSIIKQAGALGFTGDEMHDFVQRELEKEAGVTAEEFEKLKARLGGDITKFQEMLANEKSTAIDLLKEQQVGEALRASNVDDGLGDFGNALMQAALMDGGQLGYNALATGRYITDARSTGGVFAREVRGLAHMAHAMDEKLMEDIAAQNGANLEEAARVEHAQAAFTSLAEGAMQEIQSEINRTRNSIDGLKGLGGSSDQVKKELSDLVKRTASSGRELDRLASSSGPVFEEMSKEIGSYQRGQRETKRSQLKERKSIQQRLAAVDSRLKKARGELWSRVQENIAKDVQAYQQSFAEDREEFSRRGA